MSLFEELYQYILDKCVNASFRSLRYIKITSTGEPFIVAILGMFIGFFLASVAVIYQKRFLGQFVTRLQRKNAFTEDTAQSLSDLGLSKNIFIRQSLKSQGSVIRKMVRIVTPQSEGGGASEADENAEKKPISLKEEIDFATAKFYIPEQLRYRAEFRFRKRGSAILYVILSFLLCSVFAFLLIAFFPDLIRLADNTIGLFL